MTARRAHADGGGRRAAGPSERGSGTVLAVGLAGVLCTLLVAGVTLLGVVAAAHRAAAAADLAALAGAQSLAGAQPLPGTRPVAGGRAVDGCGRARAIARAHDADVVGCTRRGEEIWVRVTVPVGWAPPGVPRVAQASARAGPAPGGMRPR